MRSWAFSASNTGTGVTFSGPGLSGNSITWEGISGQRYAYIVNYPVLASGRYYLEFKRQNPTLPGPSGSMKVEFFETGSATIPVHKLDSGMEFKTACTKAKKIKSRTSKSRTLKSETFKRSSRTFKSNKCKSNSF